MRDGWNPVPLGELLQPVSRPEAVQATDTYNLLGAHWYAKGLYTKESKDGSGIRASKLYRVEQGDFVYNRLFAWKGSFAVASPDNDGCHVSNEFPCFNINRERLAPDYLRYYFFRESAWNEAFGLSSGGTPTSRNRLKVEKLFGMSIPLPPLSEQRRIVAKIDQLAQRIDETRRLETQLSIETDALLTSSMRTVFGSKDAGCVVPLESTCTSITDCLHSNPVYSDTGTPTLRSPDVGWGELFLDTARKTSDEEYIRRTRRGEPREGDIILVREGGGTGKAGIVEAGQKFSLGQRVMMLRPDPEKVNPRFLLYQWLSPLILEDQVSSRMKGSASPHLNIKALRQFDFRLPNLEKQGQMVAEVEAVRNRVRGIQNIRRESSKELDALLPSILDRAFKGEL